MKYRTVIGAISCIVVGIFFFIGALRHGFIESGTPQAGFFPIIASIILFILSIITIIRALFQRNGETLDISKERDENSKDTNKIVITIIMLVGFTVLLPKVGYPLSTFLLLCILLKVIAQQRWMTTLLFSLLTTIITFILFKVVLNIQFPKGIFGL